MQYHSKFGGLWIDRADWRDTLQKKGLSDEAAANVVDFVSDGYVILEKAASEEAVDAFRERIAASFREGNRDVLYQRHGEHVVKRLVGPADTMGSRVVDSYVPIPEALALFHSPRLIDFLTLIFDAEPLLFQSLSFEMGSQQGLHQDTAYVVVQEPLQLAACWIALEDVREGSGELMYVPGSHRLPDWPFNPDRKHWDPGEDGDQTHTDWGRYLVEQADALGTGLKRFAAKKGDILIWHADLAHGGTPITNPETTRRSLVGHFCPITTKPHFYRTHPHLAVSRRDGNMHYCSQHYDLNAAALMPASVSEAE